MFCAVFITVVVVFEVLALNFGIYLQRNNFLKDAYDLLKTYSVHNSAAMIRFKDICFISPGFKCVLAILDDEVYVKLIYFDLIPIYEHPVYEHITYPVFEHIIWGKLLRLQIPKNDLVFLQTEKLSKAFLFFAYVNFHENNYNRYRIADSSVTILVRSDIAQKLEFNCTPGVGDSQIDASAN
jgi:hypothetical protein